MNEKLVKSSNCEKENLKENLNYVVEPLISIIVVTFNSEKTVLETLESTRIQTYKNLELIITDDASTDNTIDICTNWLLQNKDCFISSKLITIEKNTGIPSNCNRGIHASHGEWIKFIAGDDILLPDCIELLLDFSVQEGSHYSISEIIYFQEDIILDWGKKDYELKAFFKREKSKRYKSFIRNPIFLNTPSIFLSRRILDDTGGFEENLPLLEDQPFIYKVLLKGYDISFLNKETVKYRVSKISTTGGARKQFIETLYSAYLIYRKPFLRNSNMKDLMFKIYIEIDFYLKLNGYLGTFFYKVFFRLTKPIRISS